MARTVRCSIPSASQATAESFALLVKSVSTNTTTRLDTVFHARISLWSHTMIKLLRAQAYALTNATDCSRRLKKTQTVLTQSAYKFRDWEESFHSLVSLACSYCSHSLSFQCSRIDHKSFLKKWRNLEIPSIKNGKILTKHIVATPQKLIFH